MTRSRWMRVKYSRYTPEHVKSYFGIIFLFNQTYETIFEKNISNQTWPSGLGHGSSKSKVVKSVSLYQEHAKQGLKNIINKSLTTVLSDPTVCVKFIARYFYAVNDSSNILLPRKIFSKFGDIIEVNVKRSTGNNTIFAFVTLGKSDKCF